MQLLKVVKSVYGLPDAPRAWFEALVERLQRLGFVQTWHDAAFLTKRAEGLIILHVDDCFFSHDGSPEAQRTIKELMAKYPMRQPPVRGGAP